MAELESDLRDYTGEAAGGPPRRRPPWLAVAGVVVAALVAVGLALSAGSGDTVRTEAAADNDVPVGQASAPLPPRVDLQLAADWQTLRADGELLIVGTHPLSGRDLALAALARDDGVFSDFPPDGVVLVAGGDRFTAKYTTDPSQATRTTSVDDDGGGGESVELGEPTTGPDSFLGPGPALALGPPSGLAGGLTVRRGDLPRSSLTLAAYIGPDAPASLVQEAEAMAATVHLIPLPPGAMPPPPPPGSRPGFDGGGVDMPPDQMAAAVSFEAPGATYTARAGADCAVIVLEGSGPAMGGGCRARPVAGAPPAVVAALSAGGPPPVPPPGQSFPPGYVARSSPTMVVLARVGPDARRVSALLVDGRTVSGALGNDGWTLLATDGRVFLLDVRDGAGELIARTAVG